MTPGPELGSDPAGHRLHSGTGCQTWRAAVGRTAGERLKHSREGKRVCQENQKHRQTECRVDTERKKRKTFFPLVLAQSASPVCRPSICAMTKPTCLHRGSELFLSFTCSLVHESCRLNVQESQSPLMLLVLRRPRSQIPIHWKTKL